MTLQSWNEAALSINKQWAINEYEKIVNGKTVSYSGDGIIYSPIDDANRPYPIFFLNFTLTWSNNQFTMKIKCNGNIGGLTNELKLFYTENNSVYLNITNEMKKKENVQEFLSDIYKWLFPDDQKILEQYNNYWLKEVPILCPDKK